MTPETANLIINLGGTGVLIWVVLRLDQRITEMQQRAEADRQQLWELLTWLVRNEDSRVDIPSLPSQRTRDE